VQQLGTFAISGDPALKVCDGRSYPGSAQLGWQDNFAECADRARVRRDVVDGECMRASDEYGGGNRGGESADEGASRKNRHAM
jgi:hypothetical protein